MGSDTPRRTESPLSAGRLAPYAGCTEAVLPAAVLVSRKILGTLEQQRLRFPFFANPQQLSTARINLVD